MNNIFKYIKIVLIIVIIGYSIMYLYNSQTTEIKTENIKNIPKINNYSHPDEFNFTNNVIVTTEGTIIERRK